MSSPRDRRSTDTRTCFWDALGPDEKEAFRSSAQRRTFAGGARLMREGETADHVMVILDGHTKICVDDDGADRTIANRGPGQLVGERAALEVSVRSATVVALDTVQALVMRTEDFAAFVSTHPAVLDIVESQVDERLKQGPALRGYDHSASVPGVASVITGWATTRTASRRGAAHVPSLTGENCTVVFTDVAKFNAPIRDDEDRKIIRQAILGMASDALSAIWNYCYWDDRGDGLLIVVPPNIPTAHVLEDLIRALPDNLKRHNHMYDDCIRIQLRAALDVGPVENDNMGVSGQAIIHAARLLEAPILKDRVNRTHANLGLIVSDFVYDTAIRQRSLNEPASYTAIEADVKESHLRAWMRLFDPAPGLPDCLERRVGTFPVIRTTVGVPRPRGTPIVLSSPSLPDLSTA